MERIRHLDGTREHEGEDPTVGTGEIEGGEAHLVPPGLLAFGQPGHRPSTAAAGDDIEQLATADVDDLGGELLAVPGSDPDHQHLVETERLHDTEPVGVVDQGSAIGDDGVIHRVPVAPELDGARSHFGRSGRPAR